MDYFPPSIVEATEHTLWRFKRPQHTLLAKKATTVLMCRQSVMTPNLLAWINPWFTNSREGVQGVLFSDWLSFKILASHTLSIWTQQVCLKVSTTQPMAERGSTKKKIHRLHRELRMTPDQMITCICDVLHDMVRWEMVPWDCNLIIYIPQISNTLQVTDCFLSNRNLPLPDLEEEQTAEEPAFEDIEAGDEDGSGRYPRQIFIHHFDGVCLIKNNILTTL